MHETTALNPCVVVGGSKLACYSPIRGFRAPGGTVKFSRAGAFVDLPITVPCGQCIGCRLERSRQWAVRCMHEAQMHDRNSFITLTYDPKNLPYHGSLDVTHWQYFAKRVRKTLGPFRFFHCGEYGENFGRPHLHAALFGIDFASDQKFLKENKQGDKLYTSETLSKLWPQGLHAIGELTFSSAAYVARYIMKKVNGDQAEHHYQDIDLRTGEVFNLKPEYTTMSRRPGIGAKWIEKYFTDVYPSDQVISNGVPCRPPKFYDQYLERLDPEAFKQLKSDRMVNGSKYSDNNTPDRLDVRERVHLKRIQQLSREL